MKKNSRRLKWIQVPLLFSLLLIFSCEKHKTCAECWENKPLITFRGPGDVTFCSDDLGQVDDFMADYEYFGWDCKLRDY